MGTDKIVNAYVLSTAAAQYEVVSSCMEEVHNSTLLLKLHKVCTDALLLISPDSACQSRKDAYYFAAVAKVAKTLLELLHAVANSSQRVLDLVCGSDRMADTKEETNTYTRVLHTSANTAFWEMTTGDIESIKYIVDQVLAKKNVAAGHKHQEKTIIRPTMLTDGKASGWGTAAGSSSLCNAQEGICRGCTINRRDVGECFAKQAIQGSQWVNKTVVISN